MADCVLPQLLQNIEQLLWKAGNLTRENVNFLKESGEMYETFLSMAAENGGKKKELKTKSTRNSILFREIEITENEEGFSKLPEAMKLKVKYGKYYLGKAKECIKEIDKKMPSLFKKVQEARCNKTQSGIQEGEIEELEMDLEDIEQQLKSCKSYLEGAEQAVSELKIEIDEELARYKIKLVAQVAGIAGGFMLGKVLLQETTLSSSTVRHIGERISGLWGLGGVAALSVSSSLILYQKIAAYKRNLNEELNKLQSELEKIRKEYKLSNCISLLISFRDRLTLESEEGQRTTLRSGNFVGIGAQRSKPNEDAPLTQGAATGSSLVRAPGSKKTKNTLRIALNMHVLYHRLSKALALESGPTPPEIPAPTMQMAIAFVEALETIKGTSEIEYKTAFVSTDEKVTIAQQEVIMCVHPKRQTVEDYVSTETLQPGLDKCALGMCELKFLGHVISAEAIRPDPDKVKAIADAPVPQNQAELRSFLGSITYLAQFVSNLATVITPLRYLTQKGVVWKWSTTESKAFEEVKELLIKVPCLAHYSLEAETKLVVDASCVLLQNVDSRWQPISYASRSLTAEKRYSHIEREAMAVLFGLQKMHSSIYDRHVVFSTDHKPLLGSKRAALKELVINNGRKGRFVKFLQEALNPDFIQEEINRYRSTASNSLLQLEEMYADESFMKKLQAQLAFLKVKTAILMVHLNYFQERVPQVTQVHGKMEQLLHFLHEISQGSTRFSRKGTNSLSLVQHQKLTRQRRVAWLQKVLIQLPKRKKSSATPGNLFRSSTLNRLLDDSQVKEECNAYEKSQLSLNTQQHSPRNDMEVNYGIHQITAQTFNKEAACVFPEHRRPFLNCE
ncbi:Retrovirus-related Pol polyprotein [Stylophora pistillata]|uniref:Retrovirus-related Pol polyprotein n=1 Tax=Stylophora pistillata TaxID=50429 RepID=A0A2B4RGD1_STYPI|nr:Retrovirus-related Pol polyprotein [Stylophora pistillata]